MGVEYFEQPILTLSVIALLGVMISVAVVAGIEELMRKEKLVNGLWGILAVGLFAGIFGACWWWWVHGPGYFLDENGAPDSGAAGAAGDMFGGLTALFSGLAFAGLLITLFMQRSELKLQRQELGLSRGEFKLQRFENTLFGLLELFNGHVQSLEASTELVSSSEQIGKGRAVLRRYVAELTDQCRKSGHDIFVAENGGEVSPARQYSIKSALEDQRDAYLLLYTDILEPDLGPYFRLLYNTMRHIDKAELEYADDGKLDINKNELAKQKYSKIVRAYLSSAEVKLLMFSCVTYLGKDFRPWVEKYQLLKNLRQEDVLFNPDMVKCYEKGAFGKRYETFMSVIKDKVDQK